MGKHYDLRRDYSNQELNTADLKPMPMEMFNTWFNEALELETYEPNAMSFATSSKSGTPSVRFMLLKAFDEEGFIFFTNYESRKSIHLSGNPFGALAFYWPILQRQVRAEGNIIMLKSEQSDEYFYNRPNGSKIGAWASPQSKPIPSRKYLEDLKNEYQKKYQNFRVPRPEYWGGYKLIPTIVEFWQGRSDRLHDRFEYRLTDGAWKKERLAP